jgi:galactose mutarotase-like enzyme
MAGPGASGRPVILRSDEDGTAVNFALTRAAVAPWRGMMLLQLWGRLAGGEEVEFIHAPPPDEAVALLDRGGDDDFAGNLAFSFGGAILLPFANRIRGRPLAARREVEALVSGRPVRLPRNWGGKAPGAEQYAMHGLILDRAPERLLQPAPNRLEAEFQLGDFEGRWASRTVAKVRWSLESGSLTLRVNVRNAGDEPLPAGVGWHPYFNLLGGDRRSVRLQLPAAQRLAVNDYDEVLPTGQQLPVVGTAYDFSAPAGAQLSDLFLDDCFVGFSPGPLTAAVSDPIAGYTIRLRTDAPVRAVQVYAPPDRSIIVLEPQTNWADPFGPVWEGDAPPIPVLVPGETLGYEVITDLSPCGA